MKIEIKFSIEISRGEKEAPFVLTRESFRRLRDKVRRRDGSTCYICGEYVEDGHVDHIIPLSKDGSDNLNNLAWTCPSCNLSKSDKTTEAFDVPIMPDDELAAIARQVIENEVDFSRRVLVNELGLTTQPRYNELAQAMERAGMIDRIGNIRAINDSGLTFLQSIIADSPTPSED